MTCPNCDDRDPHIMALVAGSIERAVMDSLDLDDVTTLVNFLYDLGCKSRDYGKASA